MHHAGAGGAQLLGHGRVVAERLEEVHQGVADLVEDGPEAALGEFVGSEGSEVEVGLEVRGHIAYAFHYVGHVMYLVEHDEPPRC